MFIAHLWRMHDARWLNMQCNVRTAAYVNMLMQGSNGLMFTYTSHLIVIKSVGNQVARS